MDANPQDRIAIDEDSFGTLLISRLVNEYYQESSRSEPSASDASAPPQPTAAGIPVGASDPAGGASDAAGLGSTGQTASAFDSRENPRLAGGYPLATADLNSPKHGSSPALHSGEHTRDSNDAYRYGEPRSDRDVFGTREDSRSRDGRIRDAGLFQGSDPSKASPHWYFLSEVDTSGPTPRGIPGSAVVSPLSGLEIDAIRRDFPVLQQRVNGHPLIWFDNAATTQKPRAVIDATSRFYSRDNSNIHRAAHALAARATDLYESAREKVRQFIGASDTREIVFVRGTTEAINLVAQTYGRTHLGKGDEILLTAMEHHANIVPWQLLAEQTGAVLKVAPMNDAGELILEQFASLLGPHTKVVAITQVSNALGTINPVEVMIGMAHARGIPVLVDGAQSVPHLPINVRAMDCDFFVFSGHKLFGPTGIGVLYGKSALLEEMPPYQGGGSMIKHVTFEKTTYEGIPQKFEAGTPDIAGVVGLGAAIDYLTAIGMPAISAYEHALLEYATQALYSVPGLRPIGTASSKASVLSFVMNGFRHEQVGQHLNHYGIAVRAGHHCAQPAVRRFGLEGTVRPSLAFYNTHEEIDRLVEVLYELRRHGRS